MKTNVIYCVLAILLVFVQCKKPEGSYATVKNINGDDVITCNAPSIKDSTDFPLSKIIDKCEMVQIETNEKSLFKETYHVGVSENYIAIHSRGQLPIKLFSRDGHYIRDIGSIGRGPGEYGSLYDIQLDEEANRLYLVPFANATEILAFDLNGNDVKNIPLKYKQTKCRVNVEGNKATVLSMPFNDQIPIAYQQTLEGEVIQELAAPEHLIVKPDFSSEVSSTFNSDRYDLFVLPMGSRTPDTLYHYNAEENRLVPQYAVTGLNREKHEGAWTYELKNHFYSFLWGNDYNGKKIIVNKKTQKADYFRLVNDFYGNIELNKFYMSNHGMFIAGVSAFDLMKKFETVLNDDNLSGKEKEKLLALRNSLDENDNEILFIGEMK